MSRANRSVMFISITLLVALLVVSGCGQTPTPAKSAAPTQAPTTVSATLAPPTATTVPAPTAVPPTATPVGPTVGGNLIWGISQEPDTLDPHKGGMLVMEQILFNVGATPIIRDPNTGAFVPYLAQSWKISDDGLTIEFVFRKDIKFHDGTPFTAKDYEATWKRMLDPDTKAVIQAGLGDVVASAVAVDDYTFRFVLKEPNAPFVLNLATPDVYEPLPKAIIESKPDSLARQPISVGPYKVKEWVTGTRIVLERNPDYKWAPAFVKGGPYIQTIEYRIIPEASTRIAALETGAIDYAQLDAKDVQRVVDTKLYSIIEGMIQGASPCIIYNISKPPFDDLRVRKAVNLAIDRQSIVKAVYNGQAVVQKGPLSPNMVGYWTGVETLGYGYDVAQAKALMKEAGYTIGSDGIATKDGVPLKLTLKTMSDETRVKVAEIEKENLKAIGFNVDIQSMDWGVALKDIMAGNYQISQMSYLSSDPDILCLVFNTEEAGGLNLIRHSDPEFDKLLLATRTTVDPVKRNDACAALQKYMIEQAYMAPLIVPKTFNALSSKVKGWVYSPVTNETWVIGAYISK